MPPKSRPEPTPGRKSWLLKCGLVLLLVAVFLGGVIWAGRWGLEQLQGDDRYAVRFADIECEPPASLSQRDFLDEVQFVGQLPSRLDLLDKELTNKLRDGFAKHAWVEKVDSVEMHPPKRIVVKLTYRQPVLVVKVGAKTRVVDGHGILLPKDAPTLDLPIYGGEAKPPREDKAGTRWGDPNVEAAAQRLRKQ